MEINRSLTSYPSTDKPWLKYYSEEVINASLPECTLYEYLLENNKHRLECTALNYFNRKISYADLFRNIEKTAKGFTSIGVKNGDIVTVFGTNTPELIYCIYALNYIGAMLKYFENEKETLAAIFTGKDGARWIHSGDVGHVDEDGFVFITGRIKRIYSTRSEKNGTLYKIFPDYVTNVIDEVDNVKESAVVCIEDPDYNYIGVAYVVLKNNAGKEQTDLMIREHMQSVLPMHSIPKHVRYIDALPLTLVGKIDYMALENEARKLQK